MFGHSLKVKLGLTDVLQKKLRRSFSCCGNLGFAFFLHSTRKLITFVTQIAYLPNHRLDHSSPPLLYP